MPPSLTLGQDYFNGVRPPALPTPAALPLTQAPSGQELLNAFGAPGVVPNVAPPPAPIQLADYADRDMHQPAPPQVFGSYQEGLLGNLHYQQPQPVTTPQAPILGGIPNMGPMLDWSTPNGGSLINDILGAFTPMKVTAETHPFPGIAKAKEEDTNNAMQQKMFNY